MNGEERTRTMAMQQQKLPLVGEVPGPVDLPMAYIRDCDSKEDAIDLCWRMRRRRLDKDGQARKPSITDVAKEMGLSRPQLSKILSGDSGMRGNQERVLQYLCGNRAIAQYQAFELGCQLVDETWENRQQAMAAA